MTAEYGMLPGSTDTRKRRPGLGKVDSRGTEIQRLVARSLRGAFQRILPAVSASPGSPTQYLRFARCT